MSMRMSPWEPEHKLFIDSELAKMDFLDPEQAKSIRKEYDERLKAYNLAHKEQTVEEVVAQVTKDGEVTMEDLENIAEAKEKSKKKKKTL